MPGRAIFNFGALANCPHSRINYFEIAQSRQGSGGMVWPNYCDANGYPTSTLPGTISFQVACEDVTLGYTGNWVVKWTGKLAQLRCNPSVQANFSVIEGGAFSPSTGAFNAYFSGTNGRVVFSIGTRANTLPFYFDSGVTGWDGTLLNLVLIKAADEAAYDAGQRWRQEYLDYIEYVNPESMRFLNWQPVHEIFSRWSQRTRETEFIYAADRAPLTSWAGSISGDQTYTCSATTDTPGSWTDYESFWGYISSANTGNDPTINCGARGAKTLKAYDQSQITTGALAAGYYGFLYSAVHDTVIVRSGLPHQCVPPEVCIDLCNQTNTNLYMCIPPWVDDDYVTQLVTLIRTTLNSNLKCTIELGNEFWNIYSFIAGHDYGKRGVTLGLNADQNYAMLGMVGYRVRQVMEAATTAWSPRSMSQLVRVAAMHIMGSTVNFDTYTLLGQNLGAYGYNAAPNRPLDWIDAVAGAPYIEAAQFKQYVDQYTATPLSAACLAAADDYDSAVPARMQSALEWLDNDIRRGEIDSVRWYITLDGIVETYYPAWNTMMGTYGKTLIGYEGGLGMVGPSTANCTTMGISTTYSAKCSALISAYKKGFYGKKLVSDYLRKWEAVDNFGIPAVFTNIGVDAWAMREDLYETEHGLEDGFRLFNNGVTVFHGSA